jgi:glycosyltransferase involved in cell wall biosynthesis
MSDACELTILMPCLNEAETLASYISKARAFLARCACTGEVVIADNGSTDGSQAIAAANGARVVHVAERGYGSALLAGIRAAHAKYVIMGDSDDSYDFSRLDGFVEQLRAGYQLVMGNRFRGGILPGAMPPLHRYFGNPPLTAIGRVFFRGVFRIENTISPILVKTRHVNRRLLLGETLASQLPALL